MFPVVSAKEALRLRMRSVLRGMSPDTREAESRKVCARLESLEVWLRAKSVLFYAPMASEVDVWPALVRGLAFGKTVTLPRFEAETGVYSAVSIRDPEADVSVGKFGIREPKADLKVIPVNRLDFVLVPGLAFTWDGCRLGRGKGFYDRWLRIFPGLTCGVAFHEQIVGDLPIEPHDVPLNCILTPTRWQVVGDHRI